MDVCLIVPPAHIEVTRAFQGRFCIGSVALRNRRYRDFFRYAAREEGLIVILDNGEYEGERLSDDDLLRLADYIDASLVVAPDRIGCPAWENLKMQLAFQRKCQRPTMFVGQLNPEGGEEERRAFFETFQIALDAFPAVSIGPKAVSWLYGKDPVRDDSNRCKCQFDFWLRQIPHSNYVHFLGLDDEYMWLQYWKTPNSVDTASLFWQVMEASVEELPYLFDEEGFHSRRRRPENYFEKEYEMTTVKRRALERLFSLVHHYALGEE